MPPPPRRRSLRAAVLPRAVRLLRLAPLPLLFRSRRQLGWMLARTPGWRRRVEAAMRAGLGPEGVTPAHVDAYFRHLADLLIFSAAAFRSGIHAAGIERFWTHQVSGEHAFREALAQGKGVVMVCPHLICHEIMAGSATAELPITVLVRKAPDAEYEALKQRWYSALGLQVVYRPQKGSEHEGLAEITAALRVLRKNQVLAMTPDLIQRKGAGIPVRFLGRKVELPAGPFFLSVRTGAPLLACFFHEEAGRYQLWTHPPLLPPEGASRDEAVAYLAQEWATLFESFLREHPDMWQFWLDKRWGRWLRVEG